MCVKTSGPEPRPTFHERGVGPAVVVEVRAVDVPQAVIPQLGRVAQTLQDGVHETLETGKNTVSSIRNGQSAALRTLRVSESEVKKHSRCCPGSSAPPGPEDSCSVQTEREEVLADSCIWWGIIKVSDSRSVTQAVSLCANMGH